MSNLLQGLTSIPNGADTVSVTFSAALAAAPEVVLLKVENTSGDTNKLALTALVTQKSNAGFTAALSQQTNTANYKLAWYLADVDALIEIVAEQLGQGRRISDLNVAATLAASDYMPVVKQFPAPHTKRVTWGTIASSFLRWVPARPLTDPGSYGDAFFSGNSLCVHNGVQWGVVQTAAEGAVTSLSASGTHSWSPAQSGDALVVTLQADATLTLTPPLSPQQAVQVFVVVRRASADVYSLEFAGTTPLTIIAPEEGLSDIFSWLWTGDTYTLVAASRVGGQYFSTLTSTQE
jgi:hypothetical protein